MSLRIVIVCSEMGCNEEYETFSTFEDIDSKAVSEIKHRAWNVGWRERDGKDLCPKCAKKYYV